MKVYLTSESKESEVKGKSSKAVKTKVGNSKESSASTLRKRPVLRKTSLHWVG